MPLVRRPGWPESSDAVVVSTALVSAAPPIAGSSTLTRYLNELVASGGLQATVLVIVRVALSQIAPPVSGTVPSTRGGRGC